MTTDPTTPPRPSAASVLTDIRATHHYGFRSGEWATVTGIEWANDRPCYRVVFPDGKTDSWPIHDPWDAYEFRPSTEVRAATLTAAEAEVKRLTMERDSETAVAVDAERRATAAEADAAALRAALVELLAEQFCPASSGGTEGRWCMNHDQPMVSDDECAMVHRLHVLAEAPPAAEPRGER